MARGIYNRSWHAVPIFHHQFEKVKYRYTVFRQRILRPWLVVLLVFHFLAICRSFTPKLDVTNVKMCEDSSHRIRYFPGASVWYQSSVNDYAYWVDVSSFALLSEACKEQHFLTMFKSMSKPENTVTQP